MMPAPVLLLRVEMSRARYGRHPRHGHPALDLKYVQAGLHALGIAATVRDVFGSELPADLGTARIVVVKSHSGALDASLAVAGALRRRGALTLAIGQQCLHARSGPGGTLPGWDEAFAAALAGDVEAVLPEVLAGLLSASEVESRLAALRADFGAGRNHVVDRPEALPPPLFDDTELAAHPFPFPLPGGGGRRWAHVLTAWGCPRPCRHCSAIVRKTIARTLTQRPVEQVVAELRGLQERGVDTVFFEDDSLFVDRGYALELCTALRRLPRPLRWIANARPDELDDERIDAAAAAGAVLLKVGVDAGAPAVLERIGKTRDGRRWVAQAETALRRLRTRGVASVGLFMVGLPGETAADIEASIELARRCEPDYLQVQVYCPYPDTAFWPGAAALPLQPMHHYLPPLLSVATLTPAELVAAQRRFYRRFYLRGGFVWRHLRRYGRQYLDPRALGQGVRALAFLGRHADAAERAR